MTPYHKNTHGMSYFDLHTHNPEADKQHAILNCSNHIPGRNISLGTHPWDITDNWQQQLTAIEDATARLNVIAIGECGLDKLKSLADIELQKEIFRAHALLAERVEKPLIIHCVKAYDELIAIHKEISPLQAWIIHGFRGKPSQAEQLIRAGLYISLGELFNPDSARAIPADRLFIESDESNRPITDIYAEVAKAKGMTIEELALQTMQNAAKCNIIL